MAELNVVAVTGPEAETQVEGLAALRIAVFREFPYLYDGTVEYERRYLRTYFDCPESVCVQVFDGDRLVGASTGLPMRREVGEFRAPFERAGIDPASVFYFGESILLPEYRGRGIGHRFFDEREAFARKLGGFRLTAFCAVERPADHPRRPAGYVPHDVFWGRRGYVKRPDLSTAFTWKDLDESADSPKTMVFWTRELS